MNYKIKMKRDEIWAEMARRKINFHPGEEWNTIKSWGLFKWDDVSSLIKEGLLITDMSKENKVIWVRPSEEAYHKFIKPLIDTYSLDELTVMAGWGN